MQSRNDQLKKLISLSTYNQLNKWLFLLEKSRSRKKDVQIKTALRRILERIFTYKEVYALHDDHIVELCEVFAALYPERQNLSEYGYYVLRYTRSQLAKMEETLKKKKQAAEWGRKTKASPSVQLDLDYAAWVYTHGYYQGRIHAYRLLFYALSDLIRMAESEGC